jgi:hypothetical protein
MSRRQIGMVVALVGVVAALIAALADPLGIGGAEDEFGWKQILLLAVGILLIISGGVLALRSPSSGTAPPSQ